MNNIDLIQTKFLIILIISIIISCEKEKPEIKEPGEFEPKSTHFIHGEKEVFFYGSQHSNDPENPMFEEIEDCFKSFLADLVLIEGGYSNNNYESKESAILKGEMALVSYLSDEYDISKENIEPPDDHVDGVLLQTYSNIEILSMYVLRQMCQYQDEYNYNPIDFTTTVTTFTNFKINNSVLGFENELSIDEILDMVNNISHLGITVENWREVSLNQYVYNGDNIIKEIRDRVAEIRDEYAIDLIINKLKVFNKIFVIMGRMHLDNQEAELQSRMQIEF